ncbi:MAG: Gfo/Idh/MocA family protein, partial [Bacillota bacterium]
MTHTLRWGILGTGNIAQQFATGVRSSRRGALAVVGSRSQQSAQTFAQTHGIPTAFSSYEQVLASPDIDAVYIALPNTLHKEWTLKALQAGKHVLCEKPFAANAAESEEMFDVAEKTGRIVIEAFMYRTHPLTHAVLQTVRQGAIGQVKLIRTSFCYCTRRLQNNIRFNANLAGGSL